SHVSPLASRAARAHRHTCKLGRPAPWFVDLWHACQSIGAIHSFRNVVNGPFEKTIGDLPMQGTPVWFSPWADTALPRSTGWKSFAFLQIARLVSRSTLVVSFGSPKRE